jgi:protein-S-isoprenylcysteine O-methyltransferase Ste14
MSWIPVIKIGIWNAWILMLYYPLNPLILIAIDKAVGTGDIFQKGGEVPHEKKAKRDYVIYLIITILLIIYSIFLPLKLGTVWFYAGLMIYLLGFVIFIITIFNIASTPKGKLFSGAAYRFSRHPGYLSMIIIHFGVGIASASWIFLLLSAIIMVLLNSSVIYEEQVCLEEFGEEYQVYMNRIPRWLGIPKSK